jgi:hypothetical protein
MLRDGVPMERTTNTDLKRGSKESETQNFRCTNPTCGYRVPTTLPMKLGREPYEGYSLWRGSLVYSILAKSQVGGSVGSSVPIVSRDRCIICILLQNSSLLIDGKDNLLQHVATHFERRKSNYILTGPLAFTNNGAILQQEKWDLLFILPGSNGQTTPGQPSYGLDRTVFYDSGDEIGWSAEEIDWDEYETDENDGGDASAKSSSVGPWEVAGNDHLPVPLGWPLRHL